MKSWREQQLSWFAEPVIIQQDYDVVEYIKNNNIKQARIHGDDGFFSQYVEPVLCPTTFSIWIENQPNQLFDFDVLIKQLNYEIQCNLVEHGVLYVAINKFLCQPKQYSESLPDNYNDAIVQYLQTNICADLEQSHLHDNIRGNEFNWVHPLTRFYFRK